MQLLRNKTKCLDAKHVETSIRQKMLMVMFENFIIMTSAKRLRHNTAPYQAVCYETRIKMK